MIEVAVTGYKRNEIKIGMNTDQNGITAIPTSVAACNTGRYGGWVWLVYTFRTKNAATDVGIAVIPF